MRFTKIYIIILLVTALTMLGTDCNEKKNNVYIDVDTTTKKVIDKEEFEKVSKNLKKWGTTFEQLAKLTDKPDKFRFLVNRVPDMKVKVIYVTHDGNETDGPILDGTNSGKCIYETLNDANAHSIKLYEIAADGKSYFITSTTKEMGTYDVTFKTKAYTVRKYYNSDARAVGPNLEHLIGVEIMNK